MRKTTPPARTSPARTSPARTSPARTSRRSFLRDGTILGGAVLAGVATEAQAAGDEKSPAQCSGMDEDAGRYDGQPALWRAVAVREGCHQEHPEESEAIHFRFRPHASR